MNCGDKLHIAGRVIVPILSLPEPRKGYSECLFQAHGLLKYVALRAIWYRSYNLKNMKNPHRGVLLLVAGFSLQLY